MDTRAVAKSTQEQAVAAWIGYLNQIRLEAFTAAVEQHQSDLEKAIDEINESGRTIANELIQNNRGGLKGIHGYIAEVAEVGVRKAREQVKGEALDYQWVNDNGPADLIREGVKVQLKFCQAKFSLSAVEAHLDKYPNYINEGGKYQIPSDYYESVKALVGISPEDAAKLTKNGPGPTVTEWKQVHRFFEENEISFTDLEPSTLDYDQVQLVSWQKTLEKKKQNLSQEKLKRDAASLEESKPTVREGAKATAVSAVIEGGSAFAMAVMAKRKAGKTFAEFTEEDWMDVLGDSGMGMAKGAARGASIYLLNNFTNTPSAVASSLVTASFGIAEQAHLMRQGELTEVEFIGNAEMLCLDASVSALSSAVGQVAIPVPVLGAVIGNAVGTMMYQTVKGALSEREQELMAQYAAEQRALDVELEEKYGSFVDAIRNDIEVYIGYLERAYSPDIAEALDGSIELARYVGVDEKKILDTPEKAWAYFME